MPTIDEVNGGLPGARTVSLDGAWDNAVSKQVTEKISRSKSGKIIALIVFLSSLRSF